MPSISTKCCMCGLSGAMSRSQTRPVPCPKTEDALCTLLKGHSIDIALYGQGKAKPIGTLLRELKEGSCRLEVDRKTGHLLRSVEPVFVQLMYQGKVLVEKAQILANGNRRERNMLLAEKVEPCDANSMAAALRGIREELQVEVYEGLKGLVRVVGEDDTFVEQMESASYPGITAAYTTHRVKLEIQLESEAEGLFKSCGLPDCRPFETDEDKLEGGTQHMFWEWMTLDEAAASGVKGFAIVSCQSSLTGVPKGQPGGA